jgi:hypothetical protein
MMPLPMILCACVVTSSPLMTQSALMKVISGEFLDGLLNILWTLCRLRLIRNRPY